MVSWRYQWWVSLGPSLRSLCIFRSWAEWWAGLMRKQFLCSLKDWRMRKVWQELKRWSHWVSTSLFTWPLELLSYSNYRHCCSKGQRWGPLWGSSRKTLNEFLGIYIQLETNLFKIRTPISFLFKANGVLPSLFIWKVVKIIHLCLSLLIFIAAPQNKLAPH